MNKYQKISFRICLNNVPIYFALLFLIDEKVVFAHLGNKNIIYYLGSLAIFGSIFICYHRDIINNRYVLLVVTSQLWMLISNVINGTSFLSIIRSINVISLTTISVHYFIHNRNKYIRIFGNVLFVISIIDQIITIYQVIIQKKDAVGGYGLFLHKNAHIIVYMAMIIIWWFKDKYYKGEISNGLWIFSGFCLVMAIGVLKAGSSTVALLGLITLLLIGDKVPNKIYNVFTIYLIELGFFLLVVVKRIYADIFTFVIVNVLHRDISFTGRVSMWDSGINIIKNLSLWGFGDEVLVYYNFQGRILGNNCHNYILHAILSGGWIYFLLLTLIYYFCHKRMKKYYNTIEAKLILYYLTVNLIMGFSEIMITMTNLIMPFLALGMVINRWYSNSDTSVTSEMFN